MYTQILILFMFTYAVSRRIASFSNVVIFFVCTFLFSPMLLIFTLFWKYKQGYINIHDGEWKKKHFLLILYLNIIFKRKVNKLKVQNRNVDLNGILLVNKWSLYLLIWTSLVFREVCSFIRNFITCLIREKNCFWYSDD